MMRGLADVCFRKEAERAVWPMSVPGKKLSVRSIRTLFRQKSEAC